MKNKKELEQFRKNLRKSSIENGVLQLLNRVNFTRECFNDVISKYVEKVVVVSHTEKGRNICDKAKITLDPDVINKYLYQDFCLVTEPSTWEWDILRVLKNKMDQYYSDMNIVRERKTWKINIGLIIEIRIPDIEESKKEQLENEQENQYFDLMNIFSYRYNLIDRRHLGKVLEEQKLSSSGITDSETVKLGKILNLDIIVLRLIYKGSQVTKVLRVDTGEVLLFKTYETETKQGWIFYGNTDDGVFYYDKSSITRVSPNVFKVWEKLKYSKGWKDRNKDYIQFVKDSKISTGDYNKLDYHITLKEIDCSNHTYKLMKSIDYSDEGEGLLDHDYPDPKVVQIIPSSLGDSLRKEVCPK